MPLGKVYLAVDVVDLKGKSFIVTMLGWAYLVFPFWRGRFQNVKKYNAKGTEGVNHWRGGTWGHHYAKQGYDTVELDYDHPRNPPWIRRIADVLTLKPMNVQATRWAIVGDFKYRFWKKHRHIASFNLKCIGVTTHLICAVVHQLEGKEE